MSGHRSFRVLAAEIDSDPERAARVQALRRAIDRRYNRPWWRLVRFASRIRRSS